MSYPVHEAASVFPMMSPEALASLAEDIRANGLRDPIVLWHDRIIDGRNRLAACDLAKVSPKYEERRDLADDEAVMRFVWSENKERRHLEPLQTASAAQDMDALIEGWRAKAAKGREAAARAQGPRGKEGGRGHKKPSGTPKVPEGLKRNNAARAEYQAAASVGVSHRTMATARKAKAEAPAVHEAIKAGQVKRATDAERIMDLPKAQQTEVLSRVAAKQEPRRAILEVQREAAVSAAASLPRSDARFTLHTCDLEAAPLAPASVDVIITDPPYPREFLPCYEALAKVACRVLKPGASCIVMVGQSYLPEVLSALIRGGLRYHWTLAYLTPGGQAVQVFPRKVNTFWKPLLWMTNGEADLSEWIGDVCRSDVNDNDKRSHDWGQSESGMADVVARFTNHGDLVLDPFCGAGTTGVVSLALGRRFIGVDRDAECIALATGRLAA